MRFGDNPFPRPLPKLRLRSPKLLAVAADHKRRFLLFLLFLGLSGAHYLHRSMNTLPSQHVFSFANRGEWQHAVPVREASTRGGVSLSIWSAAVRRRQLLQAPSSQRTPKSQQQSRNQLCSSLHGKLDEDMA